MGVVVAVPLTRRATVVTALSVAVPLVLPALPPGLVVVAAVAVGPSGWPAKRRTMRRRKHRRPSGGRGTARTENREKISLGIRSRQIESDDVARIF